MGTVDEDDGGFVVDAVVDLVDEVVEQVVERVDEVVDVVYGGFVLLEAACLSVNKQPSEEYHNATHLTT